MKLIIAALATTLAGCMSMGVSQMTPQQIRATEGLITCTKLATAYGQGVSVTINADDVRKGSTNKAKVTMTADCAVSIESDIGVAPK